VILEELAMDDDAPDDVANRAFARCLFADHPLGRDPAGDRQTVSVITAEQVRAFFAEHYGAGSMVVSVAGPHDHDEVLRAVSAAFADVPTTTRRPQREAPGPIDGGIDIDDDCEQVHIVMGGRALARRDERREALDVVNHVLGGGLSSRLFEEIRERRGLAYSVYSGVSGYADAGVFQLYAGTQPDHADEVVGLMRAELDRLAADGIEDDELAVATGYLAGSFELGLEDSGARMARNAAQLTTTGAVREIADQVSRWERVDQAAVAEVIDAVYDCEPLIVTVGPT
jgi:predicted Zn-dependent peptidase